MKRLKTEEMVRLLVGDELVLVVPLDQSSQSRIAQGVRGNSRAEQNEGVRLPKVQCIVATKSAEAGINGKKLEVWQVQWISSIVLV